MVHFCKYFKHYLYGKRFTVRRDHGSLRWLMRFKNPEGQLARWLEVLSVFDMKIEHRPGSQHRNADALSRIPCKQCGFTSDWERSTDIAHVKAESGGDTLRSLQDQDPQIKQVKDWVTNLAKPDFDVVSGEGRFLKSLWSQFLSLEVQDGILYRRWKNSDKTSTMQAILPYSERRNALFLSHDNRSSGHLGVRKTSTEVLLAWFAGGCENVHSRMRPMHPN